MPSMLELFEKLLAPPPTIILLGVFVAIAILAFLHLYRHKITTTTTEKTNSAREQQKNEDSGSTLPPEGPSFADFFPDGSKAQNQMDLIRKYGDIFTVPSPLPGIVPTQVVINEPELVRELCIRQANMYRDPSSFTTRMDFFAKATRSTIGNSITGLKGDEWSWRKKALLKEFHRNKLISDQRGLLSIVVQQGKALCDELGKAADSGKPVEVGLLTTDAAVGVIIFSLFGRRLDYDADLCRQSARDLIDTLFGVLTNPFYSIAKYIPNTSAYKLDKKRIKAQKIFDMIVEKEIELLLEEHHGTKPVHPDRLPGSFMASLIENEPRFHLNGIDAMVAEARVIITAGFETTAHSLAFAMGMMAERPDLAQILANQGKEALGARHPETYYNVDNVKTALEKTPAVNHFFHESLRLYPLAPSLIGECTKDIDIVTEKGQKYTLPKGTLTSFLNVPLQRKVSGNPDEIRLDLWDVPISEQPFLHTFQTGPHTCPGRPLALLEGRVFLLLVALQFEFKFPEGISKVEYDDGGLLRPKDGMPLLVKRRSAESSR